MPVDQTGENIIFVMEPGQVEAHIQIQYRGDAPRFSWIVPVQALPDVQVGSEALFDRLLSATVPTFGFQTQFDSCEQPTVARTLPSAPEALAPEPADRTAAAIQWRAHTSSCKRPSAPSM